MSLVEFQNAAIAIEKTFGEAARERFVSAVWEKVTVNTYLADFFALYE